jgi:prepilin-type N-terminal cleavage/methylation domain-containing protein
MKALRNKKRKGFTLVELIVVIGILLVLSVLAILALSNISDAARRSANSADANTLARALNTYNSVAVVKVSVVPTASNGKFDLNLTTSNAPVAMDLSVTTDSTRAASVRSLISVSTSGSGSVPFFTVSGS